MRRPNLNPERREEDRYHRTTIFDKRFIEDLSPVPTRRRQAQQRKRRSRLPQEPQGSHRPQKKVKLGSRPLTQPIPPITSPQEPPNSLTSTTVPWNHDTSEASRSWEAPKDNFNNGFLGPPLPTLNPHTHHHQQQHHQDEQQHAVLHPSQDTPPGLGASTLYNEPLAPSTSGNSPLLATPSSPRQQECKSPSHAAHPPRLLAPPRPSFTVTGPTGHPEPCEVTFDVQLEISVISVALAGRLGCILEPGPPTWDNWTVQTPAGLFNPEVWVKDISIESQWSQLRIPANTANFVVVDRCWTGTLIILGRPVLSRLLQAVE
ncbi:hypothetical protein AK830_g9175 [Neonectria ditissima]|uniref:Uncharacterized protein n=1 Tax=Neonectria ditissima TaxID=78410 RepID=A0A0P7ASA7_9HYPO|nr:hypothetical protein AK830_g9175 [Neonectria ditissima]